MANPVIIFRCFTYNIYTVRYVLNSSKVRTTALLEKGPCTSLLPTRSFQSSILFLSQEKFTRDPSKIIKKDGTVVRKKTAPVVMINLFNGSEMTVLPMKAAESIAKAKGLNLMKVHTEMRSTRETYKLVKDSELGIENSEKTQEKTTDMKNIVLTSNIHDHDLQIKVKSMIKILQKHKKLKCTIKLLQSSEKADSVLEKMKEQLKKAEIPFSLTTQKPASAYQQFIIRLASDQDNESKPESNKVAIV